MKVQSIGLALGMLLAACGGSAGPASQASGSSSAPKPAASVAAPAAASVSAKPAASSGASAAVKPSAAASSAAQPAASGLAKLKTSYPNVDMGHLHLWVAEDGGMFPQNGLDVQDTLVSSSNATMAALLSGQIDIAQTGGSDAVSASANGADVVVLAVGIPVYSYLLEVPASIKTLAELKGGKIGIDSYGSSPDIAVRVALKKGGLDPDKDVSIIPVGNMPTRVAALLQGAIQGTVLNPPASLAVEDKGYHPLINLAELKLPAVSQSSIVQRSWVASHRDSAQKYIDTLVLAGQRIRKDKPFTIQVMKKYLKSDDERGMNGAYDFYVDQVYPTAPFPKPEMFNDSITELAKTVPALKNYDVNKILDPSFVQSTVDRGLAKPS